jgi:hypothetical protein
MLVSMKLRIRCKCFLVLHNNIKLTLYKYIVSAFVYKCVTLDKRMTWRHHIERTVAETLHTYIRTYSLLKNGRLNINIKLTLSKGRAVAQAVSRWLPTSAARVRVRAACGVCGGQSGIGAGFLRVLRFPLPIIPLMSPLS